MILDTKLSASEYTEEQRAAIFEVAQDIARYEIKNRMLFNSTSNSKDAVWGLLSQEESEVFCIAMLDNQNRLIEFFEIFRGTINGCQVYPREIAKTVLEKNAAAIILAHNHPSGCLEPSYADIAATDRIKKAMETLDVRVLDHIIVGGGDTYSFAENCMI